MKYSVNFVQFSLKQTKNSINITQFQLTLYKLMLKLTNLMKNSVNFH